MDQGLGRGGEFWQQFGCVRGRSYRGPSLSVVSSFSIASVFGRIESCVHVPVGGGSIFGGSGSTAASRGVVWSKTARGRGVFRRAGSFSQIHHLLTVKCELVMDRGMVGK